MGAHVIENAKLPQVHNLRHPRAGPNRALCEERSRCSRLVIAVEKRNGDYLMTRRALSATVSGVQSRDYLRGTQGMCKTRHHARAATQRASAR
eukprot:1584903-Prymnesium_polylepis.1